MSNGSPTAFLLWSILGILFQGFLTYHLWSYDKFSCLRWNSGRQPGTFKRVMTYSYLFTVPLLLVFAVGITAAKYREGFIVLPGLPIQPRPYSLWTGSTKSLVLPLDYVLSTAWALELVTHLEELTFWLFLLHQGPQRRVWFHSWEFRLWYIGSLTAMMGLPLTTYSFKHDIDHCQAWIFLIGASASTMTTVCFIYVLIRFPSFVAGVKVGGAPSDVVGRLRVFYRLNCYRVVFRFFFTVPLLVVGIDSVRKKHHVITDPFWDDLLIMIGGIGCFASSTLTLKIFFPKVEDTPTLPHPQGSTTTRPMQTFNSQASSKMWRTSHLEEHTSEDTMWDRDQITTSTSSRSQRTRDSDLDSAEFDDDEQGIDLEALSNQRHSGGVGARTGDRDVNGNGNDELDRREQHRTRRRMRRKRALSLPVSLEIGRHAEAGWVERGLAFHFGRSTLGARERDELCFRAVHPYIMTFTSPIDLLYIDDETEDGVEVGRAI